jgi:hypothetical protein
MSKTINFASVVVDNLNVVEDKMEDQIVGELLVDEAAARAVLDAALVKGELDEIEGHVSPSLFNGIDWDELAHLVEIQLFMRRCMDRIEWVGKRLEAAKAGAFLPREQFVALVEERKVLWAKWKAGKEASQKLVGEEKALWGVFFNIEDHEEFLAKHLEMDVSIWNTFGRDDEEEEGNEKFHLDAMDMWAESHIAEMAEYDREVHVDWSFQDKRLAERLANKALDEQSLFAACPF